jgi:hypothetical protein
LETLIAFLPALACSAMMLVICIPMMRNMHKGHDESTTADSRQEIGELRDEIARLRAERELASQKEEIRG